MNTAQPSRRALLTHGGALAASWVFACRAPTRAERFERIVRGGTLVDGSGGEPFVADVGVRGGSIAAIGDLRRVRADDELDARGLCVAPGFVDVHSHSDHSVLECPSAESRIAQGYTTEVTGNCGSSVAPRLIAEPGESWIDVAEYFAALRSTGIAVNQALLIGHGALRRAVLGDANRAPSDDELARMIALLERALDQGAVGLSSGLEYTPGTYCATPELVALCRPVARRRKLYATHMRNEDARLFEAIDEALEVARASGVRLEISHLKASGRGNWWKMDDALARIAAARVAGIDVMADVYPYTAYSTSLTVLIDPAAREGGFDAFLARLADPAQRSGIRAGLLAHVANDPGGFELIQIASSLSERNTAFVGKTIAELAAARGIEPADALLTLFEEERKDVSFVGHGMSEPNVAQVLAHPLVMVGSDGTARCASEGDGASNPHPRSWGTAARVLGQMVREQHVIDLVSAVRKLSALPVERAGLVDRGALRVGAAADVVVFDPTTVRDVTTYNDPQRAPEGVVHVLVNGAVAMRDGRLSGARAGLVLMT